MIVRNSKVVAALITLLILGTSHALAGGFGVSVTVPKGDDPRTKDAALIVQPIGCHGPGASVRARAEGLVNGKRISVPLVLIPLTGEHSPGQVDTYMLKHEWPKAGTWVLVFTATKELKGGGKASTIRADALVNIGQDGQVVLIDRPRSQNWNDAVLLPDHKTRMLPCSFTGDERVVAMNLVSGDVNAAVAFMLKAAPAQR